MKKTLLSILFAGLAASLFAQLGPDKKIQMGLAYQFGLNFNKPGTKVIERQGVGVQNMIGMNVNFSFNPNIGFSTGLEFDFESFRYRVAATDPIYYQYMDSKILKKDEGTPAGTSVYNVTERQYKTIYASIPTMLIFRTNMIGAFRYYGKFGARTGFLLGSTINDKGFNITDNAGVPKSTEQENNDMKVAHDVFFLRSTVGVAAGAEWNFTGSTSLFAELGFYYGFTPMHYSDAIGGSDKERKMHLFQGTPSGPDYLNFSSKQKQVVLKVGILF